MGTRQQILIILLCEWSVDGAEEAEGWGMRGLKGESKRTAGPSSWPIMRSSSPPRHFLPLRVSPSPCVCQMAHNGLVIRGRGLRLGTHAAFVAWKKGVGGEPIKEGSEIWNIVLLSDPSRWAGCHRAVVRDNEIWAQVAAEAHGNLEDRETCCQPRGGSTSGGCESTAGAQLPAKVDF